MVQVFQANAQVKINRIDPTDWYVGMKDPTLQLMVYGQGIRGAEVTTDYPGAKIDSLVRLDSPNYLLIYLNLDGAKAGQLPLNFTLNGKKKKVSYTLKDREMSGEQRMGFTNRDVLYMLMPDRFANGNTKNDAFKTMQDAVCDRQAPSLRHGGDLEGIRQHLDYFNELGVTALWLTPVLENDRPADNGKYSTYHGYATTDYYRVDPRFGTNADYRNPLSLFFRQKNLHALISCFVGNPKPFDLHIPHNIPQRCLRLNSGLLLRFYFVSHNPLPLQYAE